MKPKGAFILKLAVLGAALAPAAGCNMLNQSAHRHTSSVVQYLYSDQTTHVETPSVPVLSLPLKVGIAFVPEDQPQVRGGVSVPSENPQFSEKQMVTLMQEVGDNFKPYAFVQSIELIPSAYMTARGGFANLDQLRAMFGVDVVVLLSYDQVQFTDQGILSMTYWTIVGAYVIQGEKNDTKTLMDAAVYDIASRKLLFRAPGTSQVKASATPINLSEQLRADAERGLREASTNLVVNLQEQLRQFRERVKSAPQDVQIVTKPGYKGAASPEDSTRR